MGRGYTVDIVISINIVLNIYSLRLCTHWVVNMYTIYIDVYSNPLSNIVLGNLTCSHGILSHDLGIIVVSGV